MKIAGQNLYRVVFTPEGGKGPTPPATQLVVAKSEQEARGLIAGTNSIHMVECNITLLVPDEYVPKAPSSPASGSVAAGTDSPASGSAAQTDVAAPKAEEPKTETSKPANGKKK